MPIRVPGLPDGLIADRICHGLLVGENEFEIHGKSITKGGRFASSAVVVTAKPGYELVPTGDGNQFKVQKKQDERTDGPTEPSEDR